MPNGGPTWYNDDTQGLQASEKELKLSAEILRLYRKKDEVGLTNAEWEELKGMKVLEKYIINSCEECNYYEYIRCLGDDCTHLHSPDYGSEERGKEELAENREGDFPLWCPFLK